MDRAERTALALAGFGHVLLLGALSLSLIRPAPKLPPSNPPIEVDLVSATALQTAAPDAVPEASAPPTPSEVEPMADAVAPPPMPAKAKADAKLPDPKAKPQKAEATKPAQRSSRLDGSLMAQLSKAASRETSTPGTGRGTAAQGSGTPAARTAAQLEASFIQALFAQMKRYWRAPTGVDAELLRTNIVVTLKPDGSIGTITVVSQTGVTENNENLKTIHAERAASAIRRAAPFQLPPEHYAIWQSLGPITFDKRLN